MQNFKQFILHFFRKIRFSFNKHYKAISFKFTCLLTSWRRNITGFFRNFRYRTPLFFKRVALKIMGPSNQPRLLVRWVVRFVNFLKSIFGGKEVKGWNLKHFLVIRFVKILFY